MSARMSFFILMVASFRFESLSLLPNAFPLPVSASPSFFTFHSYLLPLEYFSLFSLWSDPFSSSLFLLVHTEIFLYRFYPQSHSHSHSHSHPTDCLEFLLLFFLLLLLLLRLVSIRGFLFFFFFFFFPLLILRIVAVFLVLFFLFLLVQQLSFISARTS